MNNEEMFKLQIKDLKAGTNNPEILATETEDMKLVDDFFSSITCNNKELENLLYEIIGYCISRSTHLRKGFIFRGAGSNGKSKIARILERLLADGKCSHLHLEDICGSKAGAKTKVNLLNGCCACILEDQKPVKYVNTSLLTRIISGEPIAVGDTEFKPYCKMIFTVNEVIDFHENGFHIRDRFLVIPFTATFSDENNNRDINIEDKLCQKGPLQIIATRAVEAYKRVLKNEHFTIPQVVIDETNKYFLDCNNVAQFDKVYPIESKVIKYDHYAKYKSWCESNNLDMVSNTVFGKEILALGYTTGRYSSDNIRKTYYVNPNYVENEDEDLNPSSTTIEETTNQVEEEQDILSEAIDSFNNKLPQDIHVTTPENWQEAQDVLLSS